MRDSAGGRDSAAVITSSGALGRGRQRLHFTTYVFTANDLASFYVLTLKRAGAVRLQN